MADGSSMNRGRTPIVVGIVAVAVLIIVAVIATTQDEDGTTLANTSWVVSDIQGVDLAADVEATAAFTDTDVQAHGGCNSANGSYTTSGDSIEISPMASTLIACEDPIMTMESAFLARLQAAETYSIDGQTLTIDGSAGPIVMTAA